jgi:hypothetical protein
VARDVRIDNRGGAKIERREGAVIDVPAVKAEPVVKEGMMVEEGLAVDEAEAAGAVAERAVPVEESAHDQLRGELKSFGKKRMVTAGLIFILLNCINNSFS